MRNYTYIKYILIALFSVIYIIISSCVRTTNNDSPYPIKFYGADSIKQVESMLSYCGLSLGKEYSLDSLEKNHWHYINTYFKQYNPDNNPNIKSLYTDIHSEFEDGFDSNPTKCSVFRTLRENLVYEIDIMVNHRDTTLFNAYLLKYGKSNATKFSDEHWGWEYKNQNIDLWLKPECLWIVYRDSTTIRIHDAECDSIKKEYLRALKEYQLKSIDNI